MSSAAHDEHGRSEVAEAIARVGVEVSGHGAARSIAEATREAAQLWASIVAEEGDMEDMLEVVEERAHRLERYGHHGEYPEVYSGAGPAEDEELQADLRNLRDFLRLAPRDWLRFDAVWESYWALWLTYGRAEARLRLDSGQRLTLDQVVLLSGMSPRSVRNATAARHGEQRLPLAEDDTVGADEALAWLSGRRSFTPTGTASAHTPEFEDLDDVVFVPVAADGSAFDPGTARLWFGAPHFTVSGAESYIVEDYFEALGILTRQARPAWVRLLQNGKETWVRGVAWSRRSRQALAAEDAESRRAAEARMEAHNNEQRAAYEAYLATPEGRARQERLVEEANRVFGDQ